MKRNTNDNQNYTLKQAKKLCFVISACILFLAIISGLILSSLGKNVTALYTEILWLDFAACCGFGGLTIAGDYMANRSYIGRSSFNRRLPDVDFK